MRIRFFDYDLAAKGFPNNNLSLGVKNNEATFFLWGDSHAMAMARAIDLAAKELSVGGQSAIKSSTLPVLDWITSDSSQISYNNEIINHLSHEEQRKKIKHVILAGRWWLAFNQSIKNNKDFEDCLRQTITKVQSLGYSVSLVRQVPQWTDHWHTPSSFPFNFNVKDLSWVYSDLEISVSNLQVRFNDQNQMFEEIIKDFPNLRIIDPLPLLISSEQIYKFRENNKWNYYDDDHISADGARRLKSLFQFLGS
ncbi:SGNH hydrolase domain-containing protein [Verrucomicrobia bacterium]|nr:SGNH hydrolase domain-containing protein [Verrucomicrobiota bacterium]